MNCPKCQTPIGDKDLVCPKCKKVLRLKCPVCGADAIREEGEAALRCTRS